jgi:hypothetical protein
MFPDYCFSFEVKILSILALLGVSLVNINIHISPTIIVPKISKHGKLVKPAHF